MLYFESFLFFNIFAYQAVGTWLRLHFKLVHMMLILNFFSRPSSSCQWAAALPFIWLLSSCNNVGHDSLPPTNQPITPSKVMQEVWSPLAAEKSGAQQPATSASSFPKNEETLRDSEQLAQLARNPYLSRMSREERLEFRNQMKSKSPFQRLVFVRKYPTLSGLPAQQEELLLHQLAQIVPITTPSVLLKCTCDNGFQREMCVQETCSDSEAPVHFSICESMCGASSHPLSVCMPSQQCSEKLI
jgi:hypothetical protein